MMIEGDRPLMTSRVAAKSVKSRLICRPWVRILQRFEMPVTSLSLPSALERTAAPSNPVAPVITIIAHAYQFAASRHTRVGLPHRRDSSFLQHFLFDVAV